MEPVYLHSEPLQLVAELGFLGAGIILVLVGYTFLQGLRAIKRHRVNHPAVARNLTALLCGVLGFFIAAFLDFPLRMPAIVFMLALYLALTAFYSDLATRGR